MLTWAFGLFAAGALGGLLMAFKSFRRETIPLPLAIGHGILGAAGLVLLLLGVMQGVGGGFAKVALGVLVVAALGGFYLASFHLRGQPHPGAVIVVHALVAATGVGFLLAALLGAAQA